MCGSDSSPAAIRLNHAPSWLVRSATGRVSQNWPSTILEYWQLTRSVDAEDYHLIPNGKAVHA